MSDFKEIISIVKKPVIVAVALNIILPLILSPMATQEEIKPTNGASSLNLKGQLMHMMVHHNQVMFSSSLIIAVIVAISVYVSKKYDF
tara:strand:+ start:226 stop:489 length:264 start_codon:yes stop_codon:yes gene_type:complete